MLKMPSTDSHLWYLFDFETFRRGTDYTEAIKRGRHLFQSNWSQLN